MLSNKTLVRFIFLEGLKGCYVLLFYLTDCFYCRDELFYGYFVLLLMLFKGANAREVSLAWLLPIAEFLNCLYPKLVLASLVLASLIFASLFLASLLMVASCMLVMTFLDFALCSGIFWAFYGMMPSDYFFLCKYLFSRDKL